MRGEVVRRGRLAQREVAVGCAQLFAEVVDVFVGGEDRPERREECEADRPATWRHFADARAGERACEEGRAHQTSNALACSGSTNISGGANLHTVGSWICLSVVLPNRAAAVLSATSGAHRGETGERVSS